MSDIMTPMSFGHLVDWMMTEREKSGTVFGEHAIRIRPIRKI